MAMLTELPGDAEEHAGLVQLAIGGVDHACEAAEGTIRSRLQNPRGDDQAVLGGKGFKKVHVRNRVGDGAVGHGFQFGKGDFVEGGKRHRTILVKVPSKEPLRITGNCPVVR